MGMRVQLARLCSSSTSPTTTTTISIIASTTTVISNTNSVIGAVRRKRSAVPEAAPHASAARIPNRIPNPVPPSATLLKPRQVTLTPSTIPAYASPCSGAVRYASACSYLGVTAGTTAAPAPVWSFPFNQSPPARSRESPTLCLTSFNLQIALSVIPDVRSTRGCCAKCSTTPGCILYFLDTSNTNPCTLYVETGGDTTTPLRICPYGVFNEISDTEVG